MRRAFVVALHDGFYSAATGAGLSNRSLLTAVAQHLPPDTDLVILPVHLDPASPEYDHRAHELALEGLRRVPHRVIPVDNGTGGQTRFGDLAAFQHLAKDSARVIDALMQTYDSGALLAIDRPFVGLGSHLADAASWAVVYLPRSTALHHHDDAHTEWERQGLAGWLHGGAHVGAISTHMRELLKQHGVPGHRIIDVPDGLTEAPIPISAAPPLPPHAEIGFLLAFGRAAPYKGFDDLLEAISLLHARNIPVPHLLLAAVTDLDVVTPYQQQLAMRCAQLPVTLWTRFDASLPGLLGHPALRAVIVPSRVEPFGRIPLEAFSVGGGPVVATTAGGLVDTVVDGVTGYTAPPGQPAALADAIHRALVASPGITARMKETSRRTADSRNYQDTIAALVARLLH